MFHPFRVVRGHEVRSVLDGRRSECIDIVAEAYLLHDESSTRLPASSFLRFEDSGSRIISLPAYLGGHFRLAGIKWISSFPANTGAGAPRASAALILNSVDDGYPFACMEASAISAARTAGSAVLAARALSSGSRDDAIGIVGCGRISREVALFLLESAHPPTEWRLHDARPRAAQEFAAWLAERAASPVVLESDAGAVFHRSQTIYVATTAVEPHLADPAVLDGSPTVIHLSLRDFDPTVIAEAQNITDDPEHVFREGTSLQLAELALGHRRFLDGTISDVLRGRVRRDESRAAVVSPFGLGVLDLAVGKWVHDEVLRVGGGVSVSDFFE